MGQEQVTHNEVMKAAGSAVNALLNLGISPGGSELLYEFASWPILGAKRKLSPDDPTHFAGRGQPNRHACHAI